MIACVWIHAWQINLASNQLCGLDTFGYGTYTIEGISALANALSVNASVTSVDVGFNSIGKEAALNLINIFKQKQMVSVGLAGCDLGPDGVEAVADMIRVIASITEVLAFVCEPLLLSSMTPWLTRCAG